MSTLSILPSAFEADSKLTSLMQTDVSLDAAMQPFTLGQCLFCPKSSPSFGDSVIHMQKSHGLFVSHQQHLAVSLETLFDYLHLVIFGYRECIQCGTEKATVQAVQQHMASKGHCNFDIAQEDSEYAEFYDFFESEDDAESDNEGNSDDRVQKGTEVNPCRKPLLLADEDSMRLPSGKIIWRNSSAQAVPSLAALRRRARASASQPESSTAELEGEEEDGSSREDIGSDAHDTQVLSKRERRQRATVRHQLERISTNDRNSLMHLPTSQQLSVLATQHRFAKKVQKEERRRQAKIDRKGNKNLYAYWATETPVYQCG